MNSNEIQIIPSVVSKDFSGVKEKIEKAEGFADWIHLDITDNVFAGPLTWNNPEDLLGIEGKIKFDVHLMVNNPVEEIGRWKDFADRTIFHYEAVSNPGEILEAIKIHGGQAGVSILFDTEISEIEDILDKTDLVHIMSIEEIGAYGAEFNDGVYKKIEELRKISPSVKISIDGGVNSANAKRLVELGANNLIVGSFIWKSSDPKEAYSELKSIVK